MPSKYGNRKTRGYDSAKEARRAQDLNLLLKCGEISNLKEQVVFELIPAQDGERPVTYKADFTYVENGELVVEDVKSEATRKLPAFIIKRKLLLFRHGIRIRET